MAATGSRHRSTWPRKFASISPGSGRGGRSATAAMDTPADANRRATNNDRKEAVPANKATTAAMPKIDRNEIVFP